MMPHSDATHSDVSTQTFCVHFYRALSLFFLFLVTESEFMSVTELVRGRVKLDEVNRVRVSVYVCMYVCSCTCASGYV